MSSSTSSDEETKHRDKEFDLEDEELEKHRNDEVFGKQISDVKVMLALQKEYFKREYSKGKEEEPEFYEKNPGCWICGHGDTWNLPHEFQNSVLVANFCSKLIIVMIFCILWRSFWTVLAVLVFPVQEYLYTQRVYFIPFIVIPVLFTLMYAFLHINMLSKWVYKPPFNIIVFIVMELMFTFLHIGLSLAMERVIQNWVSFSDLYNDYKTEGYDVDHPSFWKKLYITPAVFLIMANFQILANLLMCLCLDIYTKIRLGSLRMYNFMILQTFLTTILIWILISCYSYRGNDLWDNLQLYFSVLWSSFTSFVFIHDLDALTHGRSLRIRGMAWTDICSGAIRICFI